MSEKKNKTEDELEEEIKDNENATDNDEGAEKVLTLDDVIKELERMSDSYHEKIDLSEADVPQSLYLDQKEGIEIDKEEIEREVTERTNQEYNAKKQALEDETTANIENLEASKNREIESAETKKEKIDETLDEQRLIAENDALKRGLARSSIIVSRLGNIEDSRARQLIDTSNTLQDRLTSIENEVAKLNTKKETSLSNLDIELATEIESRITTKLNELKKVQEQVLEYNNKIKQLEGEYQADRSKQLSDQKKSQYEFEAKYGGNIMNEIMEEKFDYTLKYLNTLPRTEAISLLMSTPELAKQLGDRFYDLYYVQSRRKA